MKNCKLCSQPLQRRKDESKQNYGNRVFCSNKCSQGSRIKQMSAVCEACHRTYSRTYSRAPSLMIDGHGHVSRFCSRRCRNVHDSTIPNWRKNYRLYTCKKCGTAFEAPVHLQKTKKYCSRACQLKAQQASRGTGTGTWIEQALYIELQKQGIEFQAQAKVLNYYVDALLASKDIVIECFGDYWHCNPTVYVDGPQYAPQRAAILRDPAKRQKLAEAGYTVIVLWERDIKNRGVGTLLREAHLV